METGDTPKIKIKRRTAKQTARILDQGGKIFELVKSGSSWRAISRVLIEEDEKAGGNGRGFSYEQCRRKYKEYTDLLIEESGQDLEQYRVLLLARLDSVYLNYEPYARMKIDALSSNNMLQMKKKAGDVLVKTINTTAEILGVKKPQAVEVFTPDGKPLIPKEISLTINSIYGDDDPATIDSDESDGGDSETGGDAEGPA